MNTKKALNIIILLLIVINIFMFSFILYFNKQNRDEKTSVEYTQDILKYRGIDIEVPIKNIKLSKKALLFKKGIFNEKYEQKIKNKISGEILITEDQTKLEYISFNKNTTEVITKDRFEADLQVKAFLDLIEFNYINYSVDSVTMLSRDTYNLKYIYTSNGEIIYDLYINATIDKHGLVSVTIKYIENQFEENENFYVLPMTNILMSNIIYSEKRSNKIVRVDSGYKFDKNNTLQYVWKIIFDDNTTIYYDAKNGHQLQ